jgi:hypothetical protein
MVPFAVLPAPFGELALVATCAIAAVVLLWRLHLPWWWLGFAPMLSGIYGGNPNVIAVLAVVGGLPVIGIFLKMYAGIPAIGERQWRGLAITAVALAATIPLLPWASFLEGREAIAGGLISQAEDFSIWGEPFLVIPTMFALASLPIREAAWLSVPTLWPATQFHYGTFAVPVGHPIIALVMSMAAAESTAIAVIGYAIIRTGIVDGLIRRSNGQPSATARALAQPAGRDTGDV